ncbi:chitosanase [Staphylococcus sp. SQ8-PEA]|uniref:Chitosanase n=1 Tax=Staphylococcus marylandisciuri TaxID=2981529 RepID=A0ABT2QPQ6_9STAP|nr:chitosanase [Staphylococcus marylandisciuri]MCU5745957.1 chitosanase [Staphylococcus marylandisciuri]
MKYTMKIALSSAIALSTLSPLTSAVHAQEQHDQHALKQSSQKASNVNDNNYMDKNFDLRKRCFALVGAAEDSNLNYSSNYRSVSGDEDDGRGITAGIIGFTSGNGDMKDMLNYYNQISPNNPLSGDKDNMSHLSEDKLRKDWFNAFDHDHDNFVKAQNYEVKKECMNDAVKFAKKDGLGQLGQYIYFDALVKHGPGRDPSASMSNWSFEDLRAHAIENGIKPPSQGGDEATYLQNFVGKRYDAINAENEEAKKEGRDMDTEGTTDRLKFQINQIKKSNFDLKLPLDFNMNQTDFHLDQNKLNNFNDKDLASLN